MIKKLEKKDYEKICGTSFHGTTIDNVSTDELIVALGFEPIRTSSDNKVTREWRVETEYGCFCIYDWKYYDPKLKDEDKIVWHIGGFYKEKEERLKEEISKALPMYETTKDN